ncbi:MAG: NADPH-dependent FMN reductase [Sedimentitalea sp.]
MTNPTLLGLSGSLRADATNRKLLREAARLYGPCTYVEGDLNFPLYDGDDEAATGVPDAVKAVVAQITQADGILISTPEYNKGPSGVLKNALDWISRVPGQAMRDKPTVVMSASAGRAGGERAQSVLRAFLVSFQPRILQGPEVHLAASSEQFDDNGHLTGELYVTTLTDLMARLRTEIAR